MTSTQGTDLPAGNQSSPVWGWFRHLYVQVLMAVFLGIAIGGIFPEQAKALKPLGDGFVKLVKMLIAPLVFCTIVHGVASMGDMRRLGRVGLKSLIYFEVVSTLALFVGLIVVNFVRPGDGFPLGESHFQTVAKGGAKTHGLADFFLEMIPVTVVSPFVSGEMLQVLLVSILASIALTSLGGRAGLVLETVETASAVLFGMLGIVVRLAPVGAFGAMAYTIGNHGFQALGPLLRLMACFYFTSAFFVLVVLGLVGMLAGIPIYRFLMYLKEEILLVIGTSSSETAMPGLMNKLRSLGCSQATVGLVVPAGYSFNLDGTNIYMTMAALFLAQATNTTLGLADQLFLLLVAMATSKGASGVTGSGFVTLAATMAAVPSIPVESLALLVGIDRFMSECRALTNFIGNGVATIVVSRWEGEVTPAQIREGMSRVAGPGDSID